VWHSVLNAAGLGAPLLVAVFATPLIVRGLGNERSGILTIAWAVVGYFSVFDFGMGRALTQVIAERRAAGDDATIRGIGRTTLATLVVIGLAGTLVAEAGSGWYVRHAAGVSPGEQGDALLAIRILALSVPIVVVTAGLRGALEAYERFDIVNAIRAPLGIANYIAPLLLFPFTHTLAAVVSLLVVARAAALVVHYVFYRRVLGGTSQSPITLDAIRVVVRTGGWMTISNVLSPLMVYADRVLIAAILSASMVAFYTLPYEMVTRLMIVAGAVAATLFPAFAAHGNRGETARLFARGLVMTGVTLLPLTLAVILFAREGLQWWLGADYASRSATALRVLAVGVYINCLAQIAFALVQGAGRSDLTAKLHMAELPLYAMLAWWLIATRGIEGAALAWTLRVAVDAMCMFALAAHVVPSVKGREYARLWLSGLAATAVVALSALVTDTTVTTRLGILFVVAIVTAAAGGRSIVRSAAAQSLVASP
jgi:O-antigen/teichoic acid export membrane protein